MARGSGGSRSSKFQSSGSARAAMRAAGGGRGGWFVASRRKPDDLSKRDVYYGQKGSSSHGHLVESGECEDISYSRLPDGTVEYDNRGGKRK